MGATGGGGGNEVFAFQKKAPVWSEGAHNAIKGKSHVGNGPFMDSLKWMIRSAFSTNLPDPFLIPLRPASSLFPLPSSLFRVPTVRSLPQPLGTRCGWPLLVVPPPVGLALALVGHPTPLPAPAPSSEALTNLVCPLLLPTEDVLKGLVRVRSFFVFKHEAVALESTHQHSTQPSCASSCSLRTRPRRRTSPGRPGCQPPRSRSLPRRSRRERG